MPPTDAHEDADRAQPAEEVSTYTDRDATDMLGTEPDRNLGRKTSVTSLQTMDNVDGPLDMGPNNQHELPERNEFGSRKVVANAMMDTALFMANISQLRMLWAAKAANKVFFTPILYLIITSIACQIVFSILILIIWARESKKPGAVPDLEINGSQNVKDVTIQRVHLVSVVMVFVILVTNMFITGLGIEPIDYAQWPSSVP